MVNVWHCLSNAVWKHSSFKVSLSLLIAILFISLFSIYMAQKNVNGKTNVADMVQQAAGDNLKLNLVLYLCFYFGVWCWCLYLYLYLYLYFCWWQDKCGRRGSRGDWRRPQMLLKRIYLIYHFSISSLPIASSLLSNRVKRKMFHISSYFLWDLSFLQFLSKIICKCFFFSIKCCWW